MKSLRFYCDLCEDGPLEPRRVIGLEIIPDIGCSGAGDAEGASKHVCRDCAEHIAKGLRAVKKANKD